MALSTIIERLPFELLFTEKSLSTTTLPRKPTLKPRKSKMRKRRYSTSPVPHASRRSGDEASCLLNKNPCHNPRLGNRVQGTTCDLKALVPDAWRPWPTTIYFSIFLQSIILLLFATRYLLRLNTKIDVAQHYSDFMNVMRRLDFWTRILAITRVLGFEFKVQYATSRR